MIKFINAMLVLILQYIKAGCGPFFIIHFPIILPKPQFKLDFHYYYLLKICWLGHVPKMHLRTHRNFQKLVQVMGNHLTLRLKSIPLE